MSKERIVEIIEQNGIRFGQISRPADLMKSQEFSRAHSELMTRDFLTGADAEVVGFDLAPASGLEFTVFAGRVYFNGVQYESANFTLNLDAAHNQFARVDAIVAVLDANVPSELESLAFQRLLSQQEIDAGAPFYPPTEFERATERHDVATVVRRTGTPSDAPVAPALAANEVLLYRITVPAGALQPSNVADARKKAPNLRAIFNKVENHDQQIPQALAYEQLVRNFNASFGRNDSLLGILAEIASKLEVLKYRYPTIVSGDGRCPAEIHQEGGVSYVDIPVGTVVEFGDKFVGIDPAKFQDAASNAHYTNVSNTNLTYHPLVENESIVTEVPNNSGGNVVRFVAPETTKWLYLLYDGTLVLRNAAEPSHGTQCLLMRIKPAPGATYALKRYRNIRNGQTIYSKTAAADDPASRQFDLDLAAPVGTAYLDVYGIRASDNSFYRIVIGDVNFDSTVNVANVDDGDTWIVNLTSLSSL